MSKPVIKWEDRCKEMVTPSGTWGSFHRSRCERKAVKDGYCKQHHPDTVQARADASRAKYRAQLDAEAAQRIEQQRRVLRAFISEAMENGAVMHQQERDWWEQQITNWKGYPRDER